MAWREGVGSDAYDDLKGDTRYLIVANADGQFEAGVRVTPVADPMVFSLFATQTPTASTANQLPHGTTDAVPGGWTSGLRNVRC
jgi:hypothetical protein